MNRSPDGKLTVCHGESVKIGKQNKGEYEKSHGLSICISMLLTFGLIFLLCCLLYNELFLALVDPSPPLGEITVGRIRWVQVCFLFTGFLMIVLALSARRIPGLGRALARPWAANTLLCCLAVFTPVYVLELSLKPFSDTEPPTRIFVEDRELGWRLRPDSKGVWGGVNVEINSKGVRGPELEYAKPHNVKRILYLGDSVTFGYTLKTWEETYPIIVEGILEDGLGCEIETINAGVGGYSPWQEYIYLSKEGIKYLPDLVVLSFVLNDVTEKFGLKEFGGAGSGYQLSRTALSAIDRLLKYRSSIVYFAGVIRARMRYGRNIAEGAREKEAWNVKALAYQPEREDVQRAWETTLENLSKIFDFCKNREIPVILVVFPYTFQFREVDALSTPQSVVREYAVDSGVPVLDLLPKLAEKARENGIAPEDYFGDDSHPSFQGNQEIGGFIADFIVRERVLSVNGNG